MFHMWASYLYMQLDFFPIHDIQYHLWALKTAGGSTEMEAAVCCMLYAVCVSAEIKMKFIAQRNQTTVFKRGWILCVGRGKKRTCCFTAVLKGRQKVSHFKESTPCGPLSGTNEGTKCGGRVSKVYVYFSPNWAFVIKTCRNVKRLNIWEKIRCITGAREVGFSGGCSEVSLFNDVTAKGVRHLCFVSNNQIGPDNFYLIPIQVSKLEHKHPQRLHRDKKWEKYTRLP